MANNSTPSFGPVLDPEQEDALRLFMLSSGSSGEPDNVFEEPDSSIPSENSEREHASSPRKRVSSRKGVTPAKVVMEDSHKRQVAVMLPEAVIERLRFLKASRLVPFNFASQVLADAVNQAFEKNKDSFKAWNDRFA